MRPWTYIRTFILSPNKIVPRGTAFLANLNMAAAYFPPMTAFTSWRGSQLALGNYKRQLVTIKENRDTVSSVYRKNVTSNLDIVKSARCLHLLFVHESCPMCGKPSKAFPYLPLVKSSAAYL